MVRTDENFYEVKDQIEKGLELLENEVFYFYGVYNNCFKIDDMILEVIEDPDDGYRSALGAVFHYKGYNDLKSRFFDRPLAKVVLKEYSEIATDDYGLSRVFDGWVLSGASDNHKWLEFGTDNVDDYYPCFVFSYHPDENQKEFPKVDPDYVPFKERNPQLLLKYPEWFSGTHLDFTY